MRFLPLTFPLFASALIHAAEPGATAGAGPEPSPKEAAIEQLLGERDSPEKLDTAIQEARKQGVSEQAVLEARFIFHVDRNEDPSLVALLPEFLEKNENFNLEDSEIFATHDEWLAVIEYLKALAALQSGDKASFKNHITEAFWLSPKQGSAFAPYIDRLRMEEKLAAMKIDFMEPYLTLADGSPITLSKAMGDSKAMLIQFWSPLSGECEAFLPEFRKIEDALSSNGIAVATIILENNASALSDARSMIGGKPPGIWLIDHPRNPLSTRMGVQNVPIFVLLSKEGRILAFGAPDNKELWNHLRSINPAIKQPLAGKAPAGE